MKQNGTRKRIQQIQVMQQYEKVVNNYSTEIWAILNTTGDAHPIHIHLNRFRILGRQKADDFGNPLPGIENFSFA